MQDEYRITDGVYLVGGPNVTHSDDATVFLVDCGEELVLIDSGAGRTAERIAGRIARMGFDPARLTTVLLTHCHIDHIGGAPYFRKTYGARLVAHAGDAEAIAAGDDAFTAAAWYGTTFPPTPLDLVLTAEEERLTIGGHALNCLHAPGHTPGSMVVYLDRGGKRVLFGQDIHGPFSPSFGSDIAAWRISMQKLLALKADILCEGHFGIFQPNARVTAYIQGYLDQY